MDNYIYTTPTAACTPEDEGNISRKESLEHKRSFVMHYDEMSVIMELENDEAGRFLKTIVAYAILETGMTVREDVRLTDAQLRAFIDHTNTSDRMLHVLFRQFVTYYRQDTERYSRRVMACRKNGRKGGAPKGNCNAAKRTPECPETAAPLSAKTAAERSRTQRASASSPTLSPGDTANSGNPEESTAANNQKQPKQPIKAKVSAKALAEDTAKVMAEDIAEALAEVPAEVHAEGNGGAPDGAQAAQPQGRGRMKIDYTGIMEDFNSRFAGILPEVKTMNEPRRRAVNARIGEFGPESVAMVLEKVAKSAFLTGNGGRGWRATFDWIFKPANFAKIAEGNYDYDPQPTPQRYESAGERERRRNAEVKERIFNKAMGHITGRTTPFDEERGDGL